LEGLNGTFCSGLYPCVIEYCFVSTRIFDFSSRHRQSSSPDQDARASTSIVVIRRLWSGVVVGLCLQCAIRFTIVVTVSSINPLGRVLGDIRETQRRGGRGIASAGSVEVCVHGGHEVSLQVGRWRVFISVLPRHGVGPPSPFLVCQSSSSSRFKKRNAPVIILTRWVLIGSLSE